MGCEVVCYTGLYMGGDVRFLCYTGLHMGGNVRFVIQGCLCHGMFVCYIGGDMKLYIIQGSTWDWM